MADKWEWKELDNEENNCAVNFVSWNGFVLLCSDKTVVESVVDFIQDVVSGKVCDLYLKTTDAIYTVVMTSCLHCL